MFQGKGFLHVSAHSVSLKRNNIPQLLIFSRYFSYKWMILQNANSFLSGSTASVSEWKPNYLYFLQGTLSMFLTADKSFRLTARHII